MSKTNSLTVSISQPREAFVRDRVAAGRFVSASEVVEEALALLEARERQREAIIDEIRREIQVGIDQANAGLLTDGEAVFERLLKRRATER